MGMTQHWTPGKQSNSIIFWKMRSSLNFTTGTNKAYPDDGSTRSNTAWQNSLRNFRLPVQCWNTQKNTIFQPPRLLGDAQPIIHCRGKNGQNPKKSSNKVGIKSGLTK